MEDESSDPQARSTDDAGAGDALPVVPALAAAGGMLPLSGVQNAANGLAQPAGIAPLAAAGVATAGGAGVLLGDDADTGIASRIEEALAADGRLNGTGVAAAVAEGTVVLTGRVATERERALAEELCARVGGVRAVENRLAVS